MVARRYRDGITVSALPFGPLDARTRHLCIDMQRLFLEPGPWYAEAGVAILPDIRRLLDHAPESALFTRFITAERAEAVTGSWQRYYRRWHEVTRSELGPGALGLHPDLSTTLPSPGISRQCSPAL